MTWACARGLAPAQAVTGRAFSPQQPDKHKDHLDETLRFHRKQRGTPDFRSFRSFRSFGALLPQYVPYVGTVHCNPSECSPAAKNSERGSVSRSMSAGSSSFASFNVSWTRGSAAAHRAALRFGCGSAALGSIAAIHLLWNLDRLDWVSDRGLTVEVSNQIKPNQTTLRQIKVDQASETGGRGMTEGFESRHAPPHEPEGRARRSARAALDIPDRRARSDAPYHL